MNVAPCALQVGSTQLPLQSFLPLVQTQEHVVLSKTAPPLQVVLTQAPLQTVWPLVQQEQVAGLNT